MSQGLKVAIVHDYLTQMGGAERVVLAMQRAFPDAPIYTSLYLPDGTFPEFRDLDVRPMKVLNSIGLLRRHHRWGLPLYQAAFRRLNVNYDVVLCSSSGWAHHVTTPGRRLVYCYTPARWLYQPEVYMQGLPTSVRVAASLLARPLKRGDMRAALGADRYIAISSVVRDRIRDLYGLEAEVISPPPATLPMAGEPYSIEGDFGLVVSRLLSYKNVEAIVLAAVSKGFPLVIVGEGPQRPALEAIAGSGVTFAGAVTDAQLRWLYSNCRLLIAAAHEDFGLGPLEANACGRPVAALHWGGYLDTVIEGVTGTFFEHPEPSQIASAIDRVLVRPWDPEELVSHAESFGESAFIARIRLLAESASASA